MLTHLSQQKVCNAVIGDTGNEKRKRHLNKSSVAADVFHNISMETESSQKKPRKVESVAQKDPFIRECFPIKLYTLLQQEKQENIVRWMGNGEYFKVFDKERFFVDIIPKYFKHSKYKSFLKQMSIYGFERIGERQESTFFHHLFHRDYPDQISMIVRVSNMPNLCVNTSSQQQYFYNQYHASKERQSISRNPNDQYDLVYNPNNNTPSNFVHDVDVSTIQAFSQISNQILPVSPIYNNQGGCKSIIDYENESTSRKLQSAEWILEALSAPFSLSSYSLSGLQSTTSMTMTLPITSSIVSGAQMQQDNGENYGVNDVNMRHRVHGNDFVNSEQPFIFVRDPTHHNFPQPNDNCDNDNNYIHQSLLSGYAMDSSSTSRERTRRPFEQHSNFDKK